MCFWVQLAEIMPKWRIASLRHFKHHITIIKQLLNILIRLVFSFYPTRGHIVWTIGGSISRKDQLSERWMRNRRLVGELVANTSYFTTRLNQCCQLTRMDNHSILRGVTVGWYISIISTLTTNAESHWINCSLHQLLSRLKNCQRSMMCYRKLRMKIVSPI